MFKIILITLMLFSSLAFTKDISLDVLANKSEISADMTAVQLLTLNGYRQTVTSELEELKLDSEVFWQKIEDKKMSVKDEAIFLQNIFQNVVLLETKAPQVPQAIKEPTLSIVSNPKLTGKFTALLDLDKLKMLFQEITTDLAEAKLKSFYLLANIDIDSNMTWDDVGVKPESFKNVILDSWKKLIEKEIKGFEKVVILEKDLNIKPDFMNSKSFVLKWTSTFKKVATNTENHSASYELSAHYILQNAKSGLQLLSFDFPIQKRDFDIKNKKSLSSSLASLVYNLLLSQASKLNGIAEANALSIDPIEFELKIVSKSGLTEIYQINSFLQEKFKDLKLTSQLKSYSSDGSSLIIKAEGNADKILDSLSLGGGKYPLNEQKVLIFNRADKTFAILSKESNN